MKPPYQPCILPAPRAERRARVAIVYGALCVMAAVVATACQERSSGSGHTAKRAPEPQPSSASAEAENKPPRSPSASPVTTPEWSLPKPWSVTVHRLKAAVTTPKDPGVKGPTSRLDEDASPAALLRDLKAAAVVDAQTWSKPALQLSQRRSVTVRDSKGAKVPMAVVNVHAKTQLIWRGRSYSDGVMRMYDQMAAAPLAADAPALFSSSELGSKAATASTASTVTLRLEHDLPALTPRLDLCLVFDLRTGDADLMSATNQVKKMIRDFKRRWPQMVMRLSAIALGPTTPRSASLAHLPFTQDVLAYIAALNHLHGLAGEGQRTWTPVELGLKTALDRLSWGRMTAKMLVVMSNGSMAHGSAPKHPWSTASVRLGAMGFRVQALAGPKTDAYTWLALRYVAFMSRGAVWPTKIDVASAKIAHLVEEELRRWPWKLSPASGPADAPSSSPTTTRAPAP